MNSVTLIGRLTSDPKVSYTPSETAVASFRLAVNRETKDGGADFIQCKVFGKQAENLEKWKHKGDEIAVQGRIETGSYKNRDGVNIPTFEVICSRVEYTHGSKGGGESHQKTDYDEPRNSTVPQEQLPDSFSQALDDIPF